MNSINSNLKNKFRLTALQWSALVILPLFIFALVVKVQERQEIESSRDKIVSTQNSQQENYMLQSASRPIIHDSRHVGNSDSAK
jgi:uncharacterized membrane protein